MDILLNLDSGGPSLGNGRRQSSLPAIKRTRSCVSQSRHGCLTCKSVHTSPAYAIGSLLRHMLIVIPGSVVSSVMREDHYALAAQDPALSAQGTSIVKLEPAADLRTLCPAPSQWRRICQSCIGLVHPRSLSLRRANEVGNWSTSALLCLAQTATLLSIPLAHLVGIYFYNSSLRPSA